MENDDFLVQQLRERNKQIKLLRQANDLLSQKLNAAKELNEKLLEKMSQHGIYSQKNP